MLNYMLNCFSCVQLFATLSLSLSKFWELVMDREAWSAAVRGVPESDMTVTELKMVFHPLLKI